ncbi:DUF1700 domain-containing protein [Velocimicrobium porci]|uniref:DUF1700 domain-containing protein n=1 Tax=Velocimicrobium porci TaxID=2606634 RepID=A0A6L5XW00_9FIRM|nr:hypothetical protein [Velocimicrobium porci]MSS62779.1 hypothetical protein [Velocimicrobium porci]
MNKQDFLVTLRQHLAGEIPDYEIESNIRYYEEYISSGNEKDKLNELGDPRLIARTIIDAYTASQGSSGYTGYYSGNGYDEEVYDHGSNERDSSQSGSSKGNSYTKYYSWDSMKWYQKLIAIVIVCLVLVVVFAIAAISINLLVTVVLPILAIIFIVRLIISLFQQ